MEAPPTFSFWPPPEPKPPLTCTCWRRLRSCTGNGSTGRPRTPSNKRWRASVPGSIRPTNGRTDMDTVVTAFLRGNAGAASYEIVTTRHRDRTERDSGGWRTIRPSPMYSVLWPRTRWPCWRGTLGNGTKPLPGTGSASSGFDKCRRTNGVARVPAKEPTWIRAKHRRWVKWRTPCGPPCSNTSASSKIRMSRSHWIRATGRV